MNEESDDNDDVLVRALRELPRPVLDGDAGARMQRAARAAYLREFSGSQPPSPLRGLLGRALVPAVLASVVGVYLTWAITTASALVH